MKQKYHRTLVIVFNQFKDTKHKYLEIISDYNTGEFIKQKWLAREPRAARFDEVLENGSGDHNVWNTHRAQKLYNHRLEKVG